METMSSPSFILVVCVSAFLLELIVGMIVFSRSKKVETVTEAHKYMAILFISSACISIILTRLIFENKNWMFSCLIPISIASFFSFCMSCIEIEYNYRGIWGLRKELAKINYTCYGIFTIFNIIISMLAI